MKHQFLSCAFVLAASGVTGAHADEAAAMSDLAKANGCLSCHSVTEKIVGPSFQSVSSKYAGDKDAAASLVQSIRNGSSGKWGTRAAMPPQTAVSNDDLNKLVAWVLSQKS